ncbi:HNH endonuclease [Thalassospira australica]|uniref:HNH endonuclease n=1 Tax=Thalassospira australica TaxID=1528106 RepID=UPI00384EFEFC
MASAKDFAPDAVLQILADSNPKRIGTIAWHQFDFLQKNEGKTLEQLREIAKFAATEHPEKFRGPHWLIPEINWCLAQKRNFITFQYSLTPLSSPTLLSGPTSEVGERLPTYYKTLARPDQSKFRELLLGYYRHSCAITGCQTIYALEAAHVQPFSTGGSDTIGNGILLRADLHRLFDANQIAIDPDTMKVKFGPNCHSDYASLDGKPVSIPKDGPTKSNFITRWTIFQSQFR